VVASLLLVAAVGKEHSCTIVATAVVVTGTTAVEIGTANLRVGYTPYYTLEEHR
jgi:hypothetical protein